MEQEASYSDYEMMKIFNPLYTNHVIALIKEDIQDLKYRNITTISFNEADGITPFSYTIENIVMNIMALHNHIERIESNALMNKKLLDSLLNNFNNHDIQIVKQYFKEQEYCKFNEALLYSNMLSRHKVMRHLKRALYDTRTEMREKQRIAEEKQRKQAIREQVAKINS